jgi:hypothetical protein
MTYVRHPRGLATPAPSAGSPGVPVECPVVTQGSPWIHLAAAIRWTVPLPTPNCLAIL